MLDKSEVGKRGYLNEPYRLFHLRDERALTLDYHYHEFDKLVLLLSGRTTYHIEGRSYLLQPLDVLLVSRNLIHLPVVEQGTVYERMVLWIDRAFMARYSAPEAELSDCFTLTARRGVHLYRPRGEERERWRGLFERVEAAVRDEGFASRLLADTCVTRYILEHLGEELTIDRLAGAFFLSRYYLMHRFKEVYGCSVHQYIRQKRLQRAAEAIRRDVPVLKAAEDAGFGDYSVFLRAFRAAYGKSPREWK